MKKLTTESSFLGVGWSFPPQFTNYNTDVKMVSGKEDIEQSLKILFTTLPGERIMLPDYGCRLLDFLFEEINISLVTLVTEKIKTAILYYEPRITVNAITVTSDTLANANIYNDGVLQIHLDYVIKLTNTRNNGVYPYYLGEGNLLRRPEAL